MILHCFTGKEFACAAVCFREGPATPIVAPNNLRPLKRSIPTRSKNPSFRPHDSNRNTEQHRPPRKRTTTQHISVVQRSRRRPPQQPSSTSGQHQNQNDTAQPPLPPSILFPWVHGRSLSSLFISVGPGQISASILVATERM
ncbi:uncharacterized protein LOC131606899 [Vicia villosa]|uniref:uncharacterized protein LOC131606899 n=1 Tax=Vicia villosa TaxID=3911 RepID=UPI00273B1FDF|nr:uncharacterized protein LOC131606899 [Vicia villosa]